MNKSKVFSLAGLLLGIFLLIGCTTATPTSSDIITQPPIASPEPIDTQTSVATHVPTETSLPTETQETVESQLTEPDVDYISGGLLYDDWMKQLEVEAPAEDHPLWKTQDTNSRSGKDTWRCKECHGWDYKGLEGAYGSGSHLTGFIGVLDSVSMTEVELLAWMDGSENSEHSFSGYFQEAEMTLIVNFLKYGLFDTADYINPDKSVTGGDELNGKVLFDGLCAACHGEDGKTLNFGDEEKPEYVGTIAFDNPWEFWHKTSFGHPNSQMVSVLRIGWSLQDIADVLTYSQTLPTE
jgi:thiosulfate dehydrogenase